MPKISSILDRALAAMPNSDPGMVARARRVEFVRKMWGELVEPVYLEHTNNVFVFRKDGRREMHVYVDDSLFAAELNAQREIIKWRCLEEYGEEIDDFFIHVSRGAYKEHHPFKGRADGGETPRALAMLSPQEEEMVARAAATISDEVLRKAFAEAMISDLRWKKTGER